MSTYLFLAALLFLIVDVECLFHGVDGSLLTSVTATGFVFSAKSIKKSIRAFDKERERERSASSLHPSRMDHCCLLLRGSEERTKYTTIL